MKIESTLSAPDALAFFGGLGAIADDFRLLVSPIGWDVKVIDPGNVALANFELPVASFRKYEIAFPENIQEMKFGVDCSWVNNILDEINAAAKPANRIATYGEHGRLNPVEEVTFTIQDHPKLSGAYQLVIKHGIFTQKKTLLPEHELRKNPRTPITGKDFNASCHFQIDIAEFKRIVKVATRAGEYIVFESKEDQDKLSVFTDGDTEDCLAEPSVNWVSKVPAKSLFALDYLSDMMPKIQTPIVDMHLGKDCPMELSFKLGEHGTGRYLIAPRIED